jgi:hypothetical protein
MVGNQRIFDWRIECVERTRRPQSKKQDKGYGSCISARRDGKIEAELKRQISVVKNPLTGVLMAFNPDLLVMNSGVFDAFGLCGKMDSSATLIVAF